MPSEFPHPEVELKVLANLCRTRPPSLQTAWLRCVLGIVAIIGAIAAVRLSLRLKAELIFNNGYVLSDTGSLVAELAVGCVALAVAFLGFRQIHELLLCLGAIRSDQVDRVFRLNDGYIRADSAGWPMPREDVVIFDPNGDCMGKTLILVSTLTSLTSSELQRLGGSRTGTPSNWVHCTIGATETIFRGNPLIAELASTETSERDLFVRLVARGPIWMIGKIKTKPHGEHWLLVEDFGAVPHEA
jgi:hypothetical protein